MKRKVADVMTPDVWLVGPDDSLHAVARMMAEEDIGFIPVRADDRLVGTITDRDIVVRALANGKGGDARVSEAMTEDVKYCFDDEDLDHVVQNMGENQLRRLPVMNRDKRLVGVIALADAAIEHSPRKAGEALNRVVQPDGAYSR